MQKALTTSLLTGQNGKKFVCLDLMDSGGNGDVFDTDDCRVVIKMFRPNKSQNSDIRRQRFLNEIAFLAANKNRPGIVQIIDWSTNGDRPWFAMRKYKNLKSLNELSLASKLRLFFDLCDVVGFVHSKHIVHRDIKCSNVLVDDYGSCPRLVLSDFGLLFDSDLDYRLTRDGERTGSLYYAPPELQITNPHGDGITENTDVYLLAKTLWSFINNGNRPFSGQFDRDNGHMALVAETYGVSTVEPLNELLYKSTFDFEKSRIDLCYFKGLIKGQIEVCEGSATKEQLQQYSVSEQIYNLKTRSRPSSEIYEKGPDTDSFLENLNGEVSAKLEAQGMAFDIRFKCQNGIISFEVKNERHRCTYSSIELFDKLFCIDVFLENEEVSGLWPAKTRCKIVVNDRCD